jgi:hypothetical protein
MAYTQKRNPIPKTGCGRRRAGGIDRGFKKVNVQALKEVSKQLEKASNTHAGQAKKINSALPKIKRTNGTTQMHLMLKVNSKNYHRQH